MFKDFAKLDSPRPLVQFFQNFQTPLLLFHVIILAAHDYLLYEPTSSNVMQKGDTQMNFEIYEHITCMQNFSCIYLFGIVHEFKTKWFNVVLNIHFKFYGVV